MGRRSRLASGIVLGLAVGLAVPVSSISAQGASGVAEITLTKQERAALRPVQEAIAAGNWSSASAALSGAPASTLGSGARYLLGNMQLRIGLQTGNRNLQAQGIDQMVASGYAADADLAGLYRNQAALALSNRDTKKAEGALSRLLDRNPSDVEAMVALAQLRVDQRRVPDALALLDRAIVMRKSSGHPIPESWYKFGARTAFDARAIAQSMKFTRDWLAAYPSSQNWRDGLLNVRELTVPDAETNVDLWRLMRAARALAGERDYNAMADSLRQAGYAAEAKAVLDEGASANIVDTIRPKVVKGGKAAKAPATKASLAASEKSALAASSGTSALKVADGYFGYGDYAKAAELYRAALQKGSVDANLVNSRLGLALALAGQKAEAEAALRAVTGPRAELANLTLIWVQQRA
jgi:hypothetical protein